MKILRARISYIINSLCIVVLGISKISDWYHSYILDGKVLNAKL